jgi:hypothetical protein
MLLVEHFHTGAVGSKSVWVQKVNLDFFFHGFRVGWRCAKQTYSEGDSLAGNKSLPLFPLGRRIFVLD